MKNSAELELDDIEVYSVLVAQLQSADSPRQQGHNQEHTDQLLASGADFPPILVHRPSMKVIDGVHRLQVAVLRGQQEIQVRFFDGSAADAFVLAVRSNVTHGLPLSLADRTAAAERILQSHQQWSDRAIAKVSGLAPGTVAAIRERSTVQSDRLNTRVGWDAKVRPLDSTQGRRVAYRLLAENPATPLRTVARLSGISVGTVHDVGSRLRRGLDPVPDSSRPTRRPAERPHEDTTSAPASRGQTAAKIASHDLDAQRTMQLLRKDPSLRFTETGRALLRLLDIHAQAMEQRERLVSGVPAHCTEQIVVLADECARAWTDFAEQLRTRARAAV